MIPHKRSPHMSSSGTQRCFRKPAGTQGEQPAVRRAAPAVRSERRPERRGEGRGGGAADARCGWRTGRKMNQLAGSVFCRYAYLYNDYRFLSSYRFSHVFRRFVSLVRRERGRCERSMMWQGTFALSCSPDLSFFLAIAGMRTFQEAVFLRCVFGRRKESSWKNLASRGCFFLCRLFSGVLSPNNGQPKPAVIMARPDRGIVE